VPRSAEPPHTLQGILERQLGLLVARDSGLTAVLADDQGLVLVGLGAEDKQERFAALTALAHELAVRAEQLLGLERPRLMELVDSDGRALRLRFFEWADQTLSLGYLGARSLARHEDEERVVSTFPAPDIALSA